MILEAKEGLRAAYRTSPRDFHGHIDTGAFGFLTQAADGGDESVEHTVIIFCLRISRGVPDQDGARIVAKSAGKGSCFLYTADGTVHVRIDAALSTDQVNMNGHRRQSGIASGHRIVHDLRCGVIVVA